MIQAITKSQSPFRCFTNACKNSSLNKAVYGNCTGTTCIQVANVRAVDSQMTGTQISQQLSCGQGEVDPNAPDDLDDEAYKFRFDE